MKVSLVNGSPKENGCTYTALAEVADALNTEGISTDIFWIDNRAIAGCIACQKCKTLQKCIFDDIVNTFISKIDQYDGFIFGSPVHFASASGAMTSFMDRLFYAASEKFRLKPGAVVVSARRAGTTAALDQLNKYLLYSQMPIVSSQYWPMVHGSTPEQVKQDLEGLQIMRTIGKNMAYLLKCIKFGKNNGVAFPKEEDKIHTNFIR